MSVAIKLPLEAIIAARADMCRRSFSFFAREFWDEIVPEPLLDNWHIDVLCDELQTAAERVFKRLPKEHDVIINIPPGTSKSTIATIMFPAWCWVRDASLKFITGSYSSALSLEHSGISRELIKTDRFRRYFPEVVLRADVDAKGMFKTEQGGSRFSTSVGGSVTGMHAHIIIIDDPLNPKQAESNSELEMLTANSWIERSLSTRKIDKAVTLTVLIMQRLHLKDPTQSIIDKGKPVRHICLPGELTEDVKPPELAKRYVDGLLDPVRMGRDVLRELELDLGPYGYAGQILQTPIPKSGATFNPERIEILPAAPPCANTVRYWDKAGTQGGGAYTAGVRMGKMANGKYVILDVVRGQWSADVREATIKQCAKTDGRHCTVWVEQEPGSGGKESAERTVANLPGFIAKAERVTGSKEVRAEPFAAQVNIGMVCIVQGPWNHEFLQELRHFPVGRYKDQVDAAGGAFAKLVTAKRAGGW